MKKKLVYIVLVWLAGMGVAFGQVTGKVILDGQTDNSGVTVKFIAQSPTAKTDSVYSDVNGNYSANLKPGNYTLEFSKSGLETIQYNDNKIFQVISNVELEMTKMYSWIYLTGSVSGKLKKGEIYIIEGSINVPENDTLEIESGAKLFFKKSAQIKVQGFLKGSGTEFDSIYFQSYSRLINKDTAIERWDGIYVPYFSNRVSLTYSILRDANVLLYLDDSFLGFGGEPLDSNIYGKLNTYIENSKIENNLLVVFAAQSYTFKNNYILNCGRIFRSVPVIGGTVSNSSTIKIKLNISCNKIITPIASDCPECVLFSIDDADEVVIENNVIKNTDTFINFNFDYNYINYSISNYKPVEILAFRSKYLKAQRTIRNNIFYNKYNISGVSSLDELNSNIPIFENNIFLDTVSVFINSLFKNNIFKSQVFMIDSMYESFNFIYIDKISLCYNLFLLGWVKTDKNLLGFGQKITKNVNGDSVDTYYNLFQDPKFLNNTPPLLDPDSPCLNAGIDEQGKPTNIGFNPEYSCFDINDTTPIIISSNTLSISGLVHQGSGLLTDGVVMAIEKKSGKGKIKKVSNGAFKIDSLSKSDYILYAVPNPVAVTGYLPTYYVNKVKLTEAVVLPLLGNIKDIDIYLAPIAASQTGNSTIQGRFSYADSNTDDSTAFAQNWFGVANVPASPIIINENPCKNLPVLLYNGQDQVLQSTITDTNGYFSFQNLPNDTYKLLGQRVNYVSENDGQVQVQTNSTAIANLRMVPVITGLLDDNLNASSSVLVYPNPFKDELLIKGYTGIVSIYDLAGNLYLETSVQNKQIINSTNWPSGFYMLKAGNKVQKIIKQE